MSNFIKRAVKHPGALRETVKRRYGNAGFTERGTIRESVLHKLGKEHGVTGRRARFAEELRGFRKGR
jgi:hypothetical protein